MVMGFTLTGSSTGSPLLFWGAGGGGGSLPSREGQAQLLAPPTEPVPPSERLVTAQNEGAAWTHLVVRFARTADLEQGQGRIRSKRNMGLRCV